MGAILGSRNIPTSGATTRLMMNTNKTAKAMFDQKAVDATRSSQSFLCTNACGVPANANALVTSMNRDAKATSPNSTGPRNLASNAKMTKLLRLDDPRPTTIQKELEMNLRLIFVMRSVRESTNRTEMRRAMIEDRISADARLPSQRLRRVIWHT